MTLAPARTQSRSEPLRRVVLMLVLLCCASAALAQADDDAARKSARRAQLQMLQLQQQAKDAEAAKAQLASDKTALDKQLREQSQQMARIKGALPKALAELKASEAARAELAATVASLEMQLAEEKAGREAALSEAGRKGREHEAQQVQLKSRLDGVMTQVSECSAKNQRLVKLSAELMDRYRDKGFSEVLKQREPFLGLGDVQMFNLVQEYRDKADAERFSATNPNR